ncbi:hypothetical protein PINS_up015307 [Pythium insidiosum]|nr:hypothetical protein PINS_up015307 [Pythium insidiosum]
MRLLVLTPSTAVVAAFVLATSTGCVEGFSKFALQLPNGDAVPDAPAIGHPDPKGTQGLNEFGKDWNKYGKGWTKAYCQADSDGDGFTNGQELGDPCCTWTPANPAGLITEGISHPSDKTKTPTNDKLKTPNCGGGAASGAANGTSSGNATDGGPTSPLAPVKPGGKALPADDDEDDSDESAMLASAKKSSAGEREGRLSALSIVIMSVGVAVMLV